MTNDKTILERLTVIQTKLKVPKAQRNTFGNYNYRNAEDILEAAKPLLAEAELTLLLSDELVQVGERYYIKATAQVLDASWSPAKDEAFSPGRNTGASVSVDGYAREEETKKGMDGSQITGASSSYARKYALNGLFLIDDTKDSDATNTHDKKPSNVPKAATKDRARLLLAARTAKGESASEIIQFVLGKEKPETESEFQQLIEALEE